jgi:hypothetical protein
MEISPCHLRAMVCPLHPIDLNYGQIPSYGKSLHMGRHKMHMPCKLVLYLVPELWYDEVALINLLLDATDKVVVCIHNNLENLKVYDCKRALNPFNYSNVSRERLGTLIRTVI